MPSPLIEADQEAIELAWTGNAYLDCATRLCTSLLEEGHERSIHHNRVPLHLAYLSLELFFKAGLAATQKAYPPNHDLVKLRQLYDTALPDLPLPVPTFIEALIPVSGDLFTNHPAPDLPLQFTRFRYYADRKGRPFPELHMADVEQLKRELEQLQKLTLSLMLRIGVFR